MHDSGFESRMRTALLTRRFGLWVALALTCACGRERDATVSGSSQWTTGRFALVDGGADAARDGALDAADGETGNGGASGNGGSVGSGGAISAGGRVGSGGVGSGGIGASAGGSSGASTGGRVSTGGRLGSGGSVAGDASTCDGGLPCAPPSFTDTGSCGCRAVRGNGESSRIPSVLGLLVARLARRRRAARRGVARSRE